MAVFSQYNEILNGGELETNTSEFEFTTWWESFINGTAEIRSKGTNNDEFKGSAFIYNEKKSTLKFGMSVTALSRIYSKINIIQDTYVTTKMPSVSFGDSSFIKIGVDKGYNYKSLINFDLSEAQSKFVTKANLVLYSQEKKSITFNIGLADKSWMENSIIWNYHPGLIKDSPIVKVTLDGTYVNKFNIDLKPFIKYFEDNLINIKDNFFGLVMFTDDDNTTEYKTFLSKEYYDTKYKPTVELEYLDPESYINEDERIEGRAMIHGSRTNSDMLKAKAYIDREDLYSKIKCRAYIKPEKIDGKAAIIGTNNILKGKANIGFLNDTLHAVAEIYGYNLDDSLKAKVIIPQDKIKAKVIIQIKNDDLQAKALISRGEVGFTSKANIIANNKINARASIVYEDISLKATANITPSSNITCKANIIQSNSIKAISSILQNSSIQASAFVVVDFIRAKASIITKDDALQGKAIIRSTNFITSKASIIAEQKGIVGKASIVDNIDDFKGKATIKATDSISAISSIINSVKCIDAKATITELIVNDDLKSTAIIKMINDSLKSKSNILALNDINAKVSISFINDELICKAIIELDNDDIYCFIM